MFVLFTTGTHNGIFYLMKTHAASGNVMSAIALKIPFFGSGSEDVNPLTHTALKDAGEFETPDRVSDGTRGSCGGGWN
jgi:transketolase